MKPNSLLYVRGGTSECAEGVEQLHAFAHFSTQLQQAVLLLSWVFYGFDELAGGFLIFRSGFLPRVLGVLLGISGLCYLSNGFLSFLAPSLDARLSSYLSFACLPWELSSLGMATVGLNVAKWRACTAAPRDKVSVPSRYGRLRSLKNTVQAAARTRWQGRWGWGWQSRSARQPSIPAHLTRAPRRPTPCGLPAFAGTTKRRLHRPGPCTPSSPG